MTHPTNPIDSDRHPALTHWAARNRALIAATSDAILVIDSEGRIVDFNRHFPDMWAIPAESLAGCPVIELFDRMKPLVSDAHVLQACIDRASRPTEDGTCDEFELIDGRVIECMF